MPEQPEDLLRVENAAKDVQEAIEAVFNANGVSLPERVYYTIGDVDSMPHDQDQLTIALAGVRRGLPNGADQSMAQMCANMLTATFSIELVRCTPQVFKTKQGLGANVPKAEAINEYGSQRFKDVWLMIRAAQNIVDMDISKTADFSLLSGAESGGVQAVKMSVDFVI